MSTPQDIAEEVLGHLHASIGKRQFGVTYGYAVTWMPAQVPGPQGPVQVPAWTLLITRRSPLLGSGDLHHLAQVLAARPSFEQVDQQVTEGLRLLAELHERLKTPPEAPPAGPPLALANGRGQIR